jgi:tRNA A37 methylthiotransferase MiaB
LTLADFFSNTSASDAPQPQQAGDGPSFHIKTYGCQMNVNDSDIVRSLLLQAGMRECSEERDADVLLTNTCTIRENAETKVWNRLQELKSARKKYKTTATTKIVGVLGCMAERLKENLLENGMADLVVGPDAYRDLPNLVSKLLEQDVDTAVNVQLSLEETYADVTPVRRNPNDISAFVSVMRGCNNMCSYCVVPFTRGRERSRPLDSIVSEVRQLLLMEEEEEVSIKEIVLLGQNVNSYHDKSEAAVMMSMARTSSSSSSARDYQTSNEGFSNLYRLRGGAGYYFSDLVDQVSNLNPELRVRFTSPHPKDYPPELLQLMAERPNVCSQLHMPAQSGSSSVLQRMRRGYTREAYLELIETVTSKIPDVAITSDFIAGFCGETQEEHEDTLSLMEQVQYDQAFMFAYSMRGKTHAHRQLQDDIPQKVKQQRLQEIINMFRTQVQIRNEEREVGRLRLVLVEGESKRSKPHHMTWHGRTDQNKRFVFPMQSDNCKSHEDIKALLTRMRNVGSHGFEQDLFGSTSVSLQPGDYAVVQVTQARGHTLRGNVLWRTTLSSFAEMNLSPTDEQQLKEAFSLNAMTCRIDDCMSNVV